MPPQSPLPPFLKACLPYQALKNHCWALFRGQILQTRPQAPMAWFDEYALARMQELWAEHLTASEQLGHVSTAAMRHQHREMLKVGPHDEALSSMTSHGSVQAQEGPV